MLIIQINVQVPQKHLLVNISMCAMIWRWFWWSLLSKLRFNQVALVNRTPSRCLVCIVAFQRGSTLPRSHTDSWFQLLINKVVGQEVVQDSANKECQNMWFTTIITNWKRASKYSNTKYKCIILQKFKNSTRI